MNISVSALVVHLIESTSHLLAIPRGAVWIWSSCLNLSTWLLSILSSGMSTLCLEVLLWLASHRVVTVHYLFIFSFLKLLDEFCQWCKFSWINKIKLIDKVYEMFEASVEMCLCTQQHDVLEMRVVNMSIYSEESLEDHLDYIHEILWKGYAKSTWENLLVFSWFSTHVIRKSIYSPALTLSGVLTLWPSAHKYSYLGPALIVGQLSAVQNSINIPYKTLISL